MLFSSSSSSVVCCCCCCCVYDCAFNCVWVLIRVFYFCFVNMCYDIGTVFKPLFVLAYLASLFASDSGFCCLCFSVSHLICFIGVVMVRIVLCCLGLFCVCVCVCVPGWYVFPYSSSVLYLLLIVSFCCF